MMIEYTRMPHNEVIVLPLRQAPQLASKFIGGAICTQL